VYLLLQCLYRSLNFFVAIAGEVLHIIQFSFQLGDGLFEIQQHSIDFVATKLKGLLNIGSIG
jgi:hypothetical protein